MCLAVPSRVVAVNGLMATVEAFGERREVSLMLLDEECGVAIGDYLLIQAGGFAFERLDQARAQDALALMGSILGGENDARIWGAS
jgi:hydrogenase expression/formation protein HypC